MDITENSISERARWLWQQAGEPEGRDLEFWFAAENSLRAEGNSSPDADEHQPDPSALSPTPWGAQN